MKIYIDHQKVNTRALTAQFISVGGLLLLLASVVVPLFLPGSAGFSWILTIVGAGAAISSERLTNEIYEKLSSFLERSTIS